MAFLCGPDWLRRNLQSPRFALLNTWPASLWCLGFELIFCFIRIHLLGPWSFVLSVPDFVSSYDMLCFIERYLVLGDKRSYCVYGHVIVILKVEASLLYRIELNARLFGWTCACANWPRNPRHVHREMFWREMLWKDACRGELRTEKKMLWDFVLDW